MATTGTIIHLLDSRFGIVNLEAVHKHLIEEAGITETSEQKNRPLVDRIADIADAYGDVLFVPFFELIRLKTGESGLDIFTLAISKLPLNDREKFMNDFLFL